ncbi:FRG domain-containing protein [Saccharophagus degradans]|uniref:FRG domain-containing protein n=1 Tax=Saccharophagus degradans TaxID=86304 RepID=A0AAW7X221_9GAMM|nr:FRG domain-containing protein [Saccharophagus degradans]MDO6421544.1 FRG domain-containing protein [Saccharophagus degradans]MDO6608506.1 FRG domain-containing protein [Saccharophagus degradans]
MNQLNSVSELLAIAEANPSDDYVGGWFYRGQSNWEWEPTPKAFRSPYVDGDDFEFKFKMWLKYSHNYPDMEYAHELEAMAIAQHHGFATKLLDWSSNILTAAFFACCDNFDCDARIIAYFPTQYIYLGDVISPVDIKRTVGYQPKAVSKRLRSQSGYFTYHMEKSYIIENEFFEAGNHHTLKQWFIPCEKKVEILKVLDRLSVNYKTLFPDLDGLSRHFCLQDEMRNANK